MAMNKDFGPFELKEKIGSGGMASVYLAVQKSLQRPVVLKILYPHLAEDEKLVQRFEREARAAAMMRHENIIQVIDCGRQDDVAYICMEFVEGMDLKKWLESNGSPPIEMALLMLRDLCRGMEHAHGHRIIHRDIKPANVMLTPDGVIKLMDFGLARAGGDTSSQMTMVGSVMGTPAYMSPEQATGEVVDERSDIFSTGVVAYELLGGQRPFGGDSYSTVLRAVLTQEPRELTQFNPLVPEDVAQIVRGMLQKDVHKRTATIGQVRQELENVIETMGLLRGRDLLREYATDPAGVSEKWRRKRLSRHMDQGVYFEKMGMGKIDDALLEFRRVLYLDPDNADAKAHVKSLEREQGKAANQPPAPAPPPSTPASADAGTMVMDPEKARAEREAASRPAKAEPAKPAAEAPKPARAPAKPPPKAAAPAGAPAKKKGGLPMPAIIAGVVVVLAAIGFFALKGRGPGVPEPNGTAPGVADSTPVAPETSAPAPAPTTPDVAGAPAPAASPLDSARALFAANKFTDAATVVRLGLADGTIGKADERAARELRARSLAHAGKGAEAQKIYIGLLKKDPTYRPDTTTFAAVDFGAWDAARAVVMPPAPVATAPAPTPAVPVPPATTPATASPGGATVTLTVTANPFASFAIDGDVKAQNQKTFTTKVTPGKHNVKVTNPTYGAHEWNITAEVAHPQDLAWDFMGGTGSINVTSEGGWAEIYIDGEATHQHTPYVVTGVLPGRHEVSLVREGFTVEGGAKSVKVKAGQSITASFKIKAK